MSMGLLAFVINAESQCEYLELSVTRHSMAWRCAAMSARNVKACRPTSSRYAQEWLDPVEDNPVSPTFLLSVSEGFDDEIVDIFGSAFEAAWQSLQRVG